MSEYRWRAALVLAVVILLLAGWSLLLTVTADAADELCTVEGEQGFTMYDGSCMTPSRYDATFSIENLATVPSLGPVYETVADVLRDTVPQEHWSAPASERPRYFGGVELPSFAVLVGEAHAAL